MCTWIDVVHMLCFRWQTMVREWVKVANSCNKTLGGTESVKLGFLPGIHEIRPLDCRVMHPNSTHISSVHVLLFFLSVYFLLSRVGVFRSRNGCSPWTPPGMFQNGRKSQTTCGAKILSVAFLQRRCFHWRGAGENEGCPALSSRLTDYSRRSG